MVLSCPSCVSRAFYPTGTASLPQAHGPYPTATGCSSVHRPRAQGRQPPAEAHFLSGPGLLSKVYGHGP